MWSEELELEKPRWVSISMEEGGSKKGKESAQSAGLNSEVPGGVFQLLENEKREKEKGAMVDKWDMYRINGAVNYDEDEVMNWVYGCLYSFFSACSSLIVFSRIV